MVMTGPILAALSLFYGTHNPIRCCHCSPHGTTVSLSAANLLPCRHHQLPQPLPSFCRHCVQPPPSVAASDQCSHCSRCCQPLSLPAADVIVDRRCRPPPPTIAVVVVGRRRRPLPSLLLTAAVNRRRCHRRCQQPPLLTAVAAAVVKCHCRPSKSRLCPYHQAAAHPWQWKA